jgi:hypothetical protein
VAAAGVRVLLHRVARDAQGPFDSTRADMQGRFRIRFRADTGALYLLSARYGGIEYFSSPVHTNPARPDTAIRVLVFDTSSTAPITIAARHLVVPRPGEDGSRAVLDLLVLRNEGTQARVAPDTTQPSWSAPLPAGTAGLQLGESDVSPDAVSRQGDSVDLYSPISPGDKNLTLEYVIPNDRRSLDIPVFGDGPINLLLEERAAKVGGGLAIADSQQIQGRWFYRWSGRAKAGRLVRLELPRPPGLPPWLLPGMVAILGLALGFAAWRLVPGRAPHAGAPASLLDALADLDVRYAGRESQVPAAEWAQYREQRARLKQELERALAGGGRAR